MSEHLSPVQVFKQIENGRGTIRWIVDQVMLNDVLRHYQVTDVSELPESFLRHLCYLAGPLGIHNLVDRIEKQGGGEMDVVIGTDSSGNGVEVRSSEVGFDIVKGFALDPDSAVELLYNPFYSPVNFELRLQEGAPSSADQRSSLGKCMLSTTLYPPNLS